MNETHTKILARYFTYAHLPEALQQVSYPLCRLAEQMVTYCEASPDPEEVTRGLYALLEAKDCFVRSMLKGDG